MEFRHKMESSCCHNHDKKSTYNFSSSNVFAEYSGEFGSCRMISNSDLVSTKPLRMIFCNKLASAGLRVKNERKIVKSVQFGYFANELLTLQHQRHFLPILHHRPSSMTSYQPTMFMPKKIQEISKNVQRKNRMTSRKKHLLHTNQLRNLLWRFFCFGSRPGVVRVLSHAYCLFVVKIIE